MRATDTTQEQLGAKLGIGQGTISRWVTGRARPSKALRKRIQRITGGIVRAEAWLRFEEIVALGPAQPQPLTGS